MPQLKQNYGRLGTIVLGTMVSGMVWLPFLLAIQQGDELTRWIQAPSGGEWSWLSPLLNSIVSLVTMLYVMPVQGVGIGVAIASGVAIAGATVITFALLSNALGWRNYPSTLKRARHTQGTGEKQAITRGHPLWSDNALSVFVLVGVVISAIAIMLIVTYGFGMDISQAFRYHFVYFPAVILILGRGLAYLWQQEATQQPFRRRSRLWVGVVLTMSLCGALTVANNLAYQKIHHPDRVVNSMAKRSNHPIIVAISHQSHGQTGRLMSLAWEMKRQVALGETPAKVFNTAQFFLDHQPCNQAGEQNCNTPSPAFRQTLRTANGPYDLWLINYEGQTNLRKQRCTYRKTKRVDGYKAQHYTCARKE